METTFITIQDLSLEARILYASDSIVDILGHTQDEVVDRPSWDFFHPNELLIAKDRHQKGLKLDKAAVLAYCQLRNRQGEWVCCECCFTVVYNVVVACISIYRRGMENSKRAIEAPIVRRLFSSSPQDPRYHMLTVLSEKFTMDNREDFGHEPRAALFLNRFTRTATIMYATSGIEEITGIPSEDLKGSSFYFCIAENCLEDAVRCVETAKGNDSIAYLRFWFRDPRQNDPQITSDEEGDTDMTDVSVSGNDDGEEGAELAPSLPEPNNPTTTTQTHSTTAAVVGHAVSGDIGESHPSNPRTSSGESIDPNLTSRANFDQPASSLSSVVSSAPTSPLFAPFNGPIELEAVVSCTSDGLVVCLRRARPLKPSHQASPPSPPEGIFAAPWGLDPVFYPPIQVEGYLGEPANGPPKATFLDSIREVGAFAWALCGINGSLEEHARGTPQHGAQPTTSFPV